MSLFESFQLGETTALKNRIVMAPLTRCRAIDNVPNDLMAKYYRQRAGAGLIISEGTSPSPNGIGYTRIPGAYSDEQIAGWKKIADAVHEAGGKIFVQLMHCGRIVGKPNLPEGAVTMSASAIQAAGEMFTENGMVPHDIPKEMTLEDIKATQREYAVAARRLVKEAGVDGIELHSANGYLLNQFLNPNSNQRKDAYGGSVENRTRFVLETAQLVVDEIGGAKTGIRLSPYGAFNDMMSDYEDLVNTFVYLSENLAKMNLAYMHIVDQRVAFAAPAFTTDIHKIIKESFGGTIITGGDVNSKEKAEAILNKNMDLVYVGRPFISNPDFVEKIKDGKELAAYNPDLFYSPGPEGYTDY